MCKKCWNRVDILVFLEQFVKRELQKKPDKQFLLEIGRERVKNKQVYSKYARRMTINCFSN